MSSLNYSDRFNKTAASNFETFFIDLIRWQISERVLKINGKLWYVVAELELVNYAVLKIKLNAPEQALGTVKDLTCSAYFVYP